MARKSGETFICSNCGEEVPLKARACPHCGADDETAWKDGAQHSASLPDDDFDYDEFVRTEIKGGKPKNSRAWIGWVALMLLAVMAWLVVRNWI